MRIVGLVEGADHVCARYRLDAYRPALARSGHRLDLRPLPQTALEWAALVRSLRKTDAVILQRRLLQGWQLYLLRRSARRLVYDFDDALFIRDSYSSKGFTSTTRLGRFVATVRAADVVSAGNDYLAEQARFWRGESDVHVIPTCVEPSLYPRAAHARRDRGVELVWIGSTSTLQGLERARPILEQVGRECPGLSLKLVSDRFLTLDHLPVIRCPWSRAGEGAALAAADIGLSWVPDDLWSRGKCGLKVLQYLAAGLPVVANPVGVQAELVRPGETGLLAETPAQWSGAIRQLAANPALRREMGAAGRRLVAERYAIATGAQRWIELLDGLARRRRSA